MEVNLKEFIEKKRHVPGWKTNIVKKELRGNVMNMLLAEMWEYMKRNGEEAGKISYRWWSYIIQS